MFVFTLECGAVDRKEKGIVGGQCGAVFPSFFMTKTAPQSVAPGPPTILVSTCSSGSISSGTRLGPPRDTTRV